MGLSSLTCLLLAATVAGAGALLSPGISSRALLERDGDHYRATLEVLQNNRIIVIQHPSTSIITAWHPPCQFDVTAAFQQRVTNTSCDPYKKTLSLSLLSATKSDLGWYQCYATTIHGTKIDSCSVELNTAAPQIHIAPAAVVKGLAGQNLTLTCVVTKASPPVPEDGYSWSHLPSPQGQRRPLVGRTRTLTLGPVTREDRGQYFCKASNDQDNRWNLRAGHASVTLNVSYLGQVRTSSDLTVERKALVTLTCKVDSNPAARLAWMVEGQEVRHVTGNVDHYVVERAACSDSKTYTCRASNPDLPGLESNASTTLTVSCGQEYTVLFCTNKGGPVSLRWRLPNPYKSGTVVIMAPSHSELLECQGGSVSVAPAYQQRVQGATSANGQIQLQLTRVTSRDQGVYQCREGSAQGRILDKCRQELCYIEINKPNIHPKGLELEGQCVMLSCIGMVPYSEREIGLRYEFDWFKDSVFLPDQRGQHLTIANMTQSDKGQYTCRITEVQRTCATSAESAPFQLHMFMSPSLSIKVSNGTAEVTAAALNITIVDNVTLICEVKSASPPVARDGYRWTVTRSGSGQEEQLEEKTNSLKLSPLSRQSSGVYACRAYNDEGYEGQIPPGRTSINISVFSKEGPTSDSKTELTALAVIPVVVVIGSTAVCCFRRRRNDHYSHVIRNGQDDVQLSDSPAKQVTAPDNNDSDSR